MSFSTIQPLVRHKIFASDQPDAIQNRLASFYNDTALHLEPAGRYRGIALEMFALPLGGITLTAMNWPLGVRGEAPRLEAAYDFCSVTRGSAEVIVGAETISCAAATGFVLSPSRPMRVFSDRDHSNFCIKVPQSLVTAQLRALIGHEINEPLEFETALRFQQQPLDCAWRFVRHIVKEGELTDSILSHPLICSRLCETILTTLLFAQPHNYSAKLHRDVHAAEPRYVRQVEEHLDAHCDQSVSARDLAVIAGVSVSALYAGFQRHRGYTPLEFLKHVRLRRVRDALLVAPPGTRVGEIAARWGFSHAGRFSQDYRRRFGEYPAQTLTRSAAREL